MKLLHCLNVSKVISSFSWLTSLLLFLVCVWTHAPTPPFNPHHKQCSLLWPNCRQGTDEILNGYISGDSWSKSESHFQEDSLH